MKRFIFILAVIAGLGLNMGKAYAQIDTLKTTNDSIQLVDMGKKLRPGKIRRDSIRFAMAAAGHNARKASILSASFPGLGQIYNRKYWKLPLIYGGFAGLGYAFVFNNNHYKDYKQAYYDILDDDPNTKSYEQVIKTQGLDYDNASDRKFATDVLQRGRDYYRRYRDLSVIGAVALWALNIIDASVDAHLIDFDVSEKLSVNFEPLPMSTVTNQQVVGLRCNIKF